jgi:hypothetical protein
MTKRVWTLALAAAAVVTATWQGTASAFCGFYVSGAEARLTNNATQVVLMREGTRTVLSMQNNYQGPPQDFAMVVPVPVVLHKENVKTLPRDVFDRVDRLTAPRLVEYWEQDPCPKPMKAMDACPFCGGGLGALGHGGSAPAMASAPPPVKIEARFTVGEYDIVVLSATDSSALDTWLRQNQYRIPAGAEPYLRPYVQMGMKFFVAKVDVTKVRFEPSGNGPDQAVLSPLRFHYDSDAFNLPIRLGLINSGGTQDLVVTILAQGQRYEVANYDNVAIPTNIDVSDATRKEFAPFYATLFDDTVRKHPRSVVTEYSWSAGSCDPCPTPPLQAGDLMTLGADALPSAAPLPPPGGGAPILRPMPRPPSGDFVLTRLHARYSKDVLGDDLFFRPASPIVGGRETVQDGGSLEQGARPDAQNNFQARYVIRHAWTGPIACSHPQRGVWGGPPGRDPWGSAPLGVKPATRIGLLPRAGAVSLATFLRGVLPPERLLSSRAPTPGFFAPLPVTLVDAPAPAPEDAAVNELAATRDASMGDAAPPWPPTAPPQGGCAGCAASSGDATTASAIAALVGLMFTRLRRRRG